MISGPSLPRRNATISSRPDRLIGLPLQVHAPEVAVFELPDLFQCGKVHAHSLPSRLTLRKNLF